MEKNYFLVIGVIIVVLAAAVGIWYGVSPSSFKAIISPGTAGTVSGTENVPAAANGFATRQEAPENVVVPEPGSGENSGVAVPKTSVQAAPGVSAKLRTFEISANGGKYVPSTIIVNVGDTVHVNFKAEDNAYDIVFPDYGLSQTAKRGETKIIEFQANVDGQFAFYCKNACPKGEMKGTLIVAK